MSCDDVCVCVCEILTDTILGGGTHHGALCGGGHLAPLLFVHGIGAERFLSRKIVRVFVSVNVCVWKRTKDDAA